MTNTVEEPQPQTEAYDLADFGERALARIVDTAVMAVLGLLMSGIAFRVAVALGVFDDVGAYFLVFMVLTLLGLIPVACYEAMFTSRRGYTPGKGPTVQVIRWEEYLNPTGVDRYPDMFFSVIRCAVPGVFLLVALFTGGLGLLLWAAVYLSARFDKDGRGWHDKAAGTIVVKAPHPTPPVRRDVARDAPPDPVVREASPEPVGRWDMKFSAAVTSFMSNRANRSKKTTARRHATRNALFAAVFVAVCVLAVKNTFFGGPGFDRYDDDLRGTHEINGRFAFGQRTGPDGDGCWPENHRNYTGRVFCDLVSIGGLHWDTGDIKVTTSGDIYMGSGHLCLVDTHNTPWCWEWSSDVPPRPARVPDIAEFHRITGDGDFLCGQTPDYATVACWTIGVEQSEYWEDIRQVNLHVPELTVFNPESIVFNPSDGGSYFAAFQRDGRMRRVSEFTAR